MKTLALKWLICIFILALAVSCLSEKSNDSNQQEKSPDLPGLKSDLIGTEKWLFDASRDQVVESKDGTLLFIPAGAFKDGRGEIVQGEIELEYLELSDPGETMMAGFALDEKNGNLSTELTFKLEARKEEEELQVNPENPLYIELNVSQHARLYGLSGDKEKIKRNEKSESVKYLLPVDLADMNFYPPGFELNLMAGLPFRGHDERSAMLTDSLYYSFSTNQMEEVMLVVDTVSLLDEADSTTYTALEIRPNRDCGIDPASIQALREWKFQNTLISTREFEERLKYIFLSCRNDILDLYVNNLDKNLWEIDEMVVKKLNNKTEIQSKFKEFASRKEGRLKQDVKADKLRAFYKNKKEDFQRKLKKAHEDYKGAEKEKDELAAEKRQEYYALLQDRQDYRMKKFGFELKETGWYNAARKVHLKDVETFDLNIEVVNGDDFDRVHAYVVNERINSLFSFNSLDNVKFNHVFEYDPHLLLWKGQEFMVVAVGYKEELVAFSEMSYTQAPVVNAKLNLEVIDANEFRRAVKPYSRGYKKENKLLVDLEYQTFFDKEKKRKQRKIKEETFLRKLFHTVYPCCEIAYPYPVVEGD